jgi:hypothetical protein
VNAWAQRQSYRPGRGNLRRICASRCPPSQSELGSATGRRRSTGKSYLETMALWLVFRNSRICPSMLQCPCPWTGTLTTNRQISS